MVQESGKCMQNEMLNIVIVCLGDTQFHTVGKKRVCECICTVCTHAPLAQCKFKRWCVLYQVFRASHIYESLQTLDQRHEQACYLRGAMRQKLARKSAPNGWGIVEPVAQARSSMIK